jgi:hypothetical protein
MRTLIIVIITASILLGGYCYEIQRVAKLEERAKLELEYDCWKNTAQILHDSLLATTGRDVPVPVLIYFKVKTLEEIPDSILTNESCAPCWILHSEINTDDEKNRLLDINELYFNDYELAAEVRAKRSVQSANVR